MYWRMQGPNSLENSGKLLDSVATEFLSLPVELILEILSNLDGKALLAMKDVRLLFHRRESME
jgi:hypothetical protein